MTDNSAENVASVPPGSVKLVSSFPTSSGRQPASCKGIKTTLSPLVSAWCSTENHCKGDPARSTFCCRVFFCKREPLFMLHWNSLPALKLVRGPAAFYNFLCGVFLQQTLNSSFRFGKDSLYVSLQKLKDAFLTLKFKTALGTKMIGRLWKRVVSCAVTNFIFNYVF